MTPLRAERHGEFGSWKLTRDGNTIADNLDREDAELFAAAEGMRERIAILEQERDAALVHGPEDLVAEVERLRGALEVSTAALKLANRGLGPLRAALRECVGVLRFGKLDGRFMEDRNAIAAVEHAEEALR